MPISPQEAAAYATMQQIQSDPYLQAILRGPALNTVVAQRLTGGGSPVTTRNIEAAPVPGRAAYEVPQVTFGTHDDATGDPFTSAMGRLQAAKDGPHDYSQPFSDPSQDSGSTAKLSTAAGYVGNPYATGEEDHGWLGNLLPAGVSNFVSDAATGMAYADPREPASMAFGKAFAGAQASNAARLDRKRADQNAAAAWQEHQDDKAYERGEDRKKHGEWQQLFGLKTAQEERETNKAILDGTLIDANINLSEARANKLNRELLSGGGLNEKQSKYVADGFASMYRSSLPSGQMEAYDPQQITDAYQKAYDYAQRLSEYFKGGGDVSKLKPIAPGETPDVPSEDDTSDSPAADDPDMPPASSESAAPGETEAAPAAPGTTGDGSPKSPMIIPPEVYADGDWQKWAQEQVDKAGHPLIFANPDPTSPHKTVQYPPAR